MIEYRCPACEALAYSAAGGLRRGGCPACGADLQEGDVAARSRPREPQPEELIPPYEPFPMNASVQAVRAPEGLRG